MTPPIPRISAVLPLPGHVLLVLFHDGEARRYDVSPIVGEGVFAPLAQMEEFQRVRIVGSGIGVEWPSGADLSSLTLYERGEPVPADVAEVRSGRRTAWERVYRAVFGVSPQPAEAEVRGAA